MNNRDYTISVLEDYSRLDEVYRLTHDTLAESGNIKQTIDGKIATCPHLDKIPETTILIAEYQGKIVGTISVTVDSSQGLHTDNWFKPETDEIRSTISGNLASSWRIATDPNYRGSRLLVISLIKGAFNIVLEKECKACLFTFLNKHVRIYQRIINAEVVKTRSVTLADNIKTDLTMMKMDVNSGWERFKLIE